MCSIMKIVAAIAAALLVAYVTGELHRPFLPLLVPEMISADTWVSVRQMTEIVMAPFGTQSWPKRRLSRRLLTC